MVTLGTTSGLRKRCPRGKFTKNLHRRQRLPGRGDGKELLQRPMMLVLTQINHSPAAFNNYRNRVVFGAHSAHHSAMSRADWLQRLSCVFAIPNASVTVHSTAPCGTKRRRAHFNSGSKTITNYAQFLRQVNNASRIYGIIEFDDLSPQYAKAIRTMAPPPASAAPFLFAGRFTVFFNIMPVDECIIVAPHVDANGSGPLVYGPSVHGACTSIVVCAPDYTKSREEVPAIMKSVFSDRFTQATSAAQPKEAHVVSMNAAGAHVNLPAGCWHAVRSYGTSMRVSYYFVEHKL